jgi:hypothetical membrane protein
MTSSSLSIRRTRQIAFASAAARQGAGACLGVAGAVILLAIITAEALYPVAYSTHGSEISDLGGTRPPEGLVFQPSAAIFDSSMIVVGLLLVAGAVLVQRVFGRRSVALPIAILGLSAFGVGIFPGNTGTPHALAAMATFISGGVAALTSSRVAHGPFRLLFAVLGAITLVTLGSYLLLGDASPIAGLGIGGIERWIVYPVVVWVIAFGGYVAGPGEAGVRAGPDDHAEAPLLG